MNMEPKRQKSGVRSKKPEGVQSSPDSTSSFIPHPVQGRCPKRDSRPSSFSSAFTLVELLVVLVIIGILAGMGITAMQHIGRAQALNSGARQFANHINMARNFAIVNSSNICLVVATDQTTNHPDMAYATYGFCYPSNGVSYESLLLSTEITNVVYAEDIQYLPKGVVFSTNVSGVLTKSIPFPTESDSRKTVWCIIFSTEGQIFPFSDRPTFELFEGVVTGTGPKPIRTGTSTNSYRIQVNPLIGKPLVTKFP